MAWKIVTLSLLMTLLPGIRTQAPQATGTGGATGTAGTAGTGGATGRASTMTNSPQHPFCNTPPMALTPKMPIFHMDVKTGFFNGYTSNQSIIVEIKAKYPEVWRINQVFLQVPDDNHYLNRGRPNDYRYHRAVGHWAWNLLRATPQEPDMGGTQPVDCGGISSYGPFGMLTSMGAHAAMQVSTNNDPNYPKKGWSKIVAKWVPPTNWQNIVYRKMITIEAYVTFERTPPNHDPYHSYSYSGYGYQRPARWIKKTASLLNLDYIDIHNYLIMTFGPQYNQFFGAPRPVVKEL